jgi:hypothetical protein
VTTPTLPAQVASIAPTILRWPGGSGADLYHWQNHTFCYANASGTGYVSQAEWNPASTFDNFMADIMQPGQYGGAITVAYGTNAACNGPGVPTEAAAWVAYAKQKGYNSQIHYWTVGNEEYGGWEVDLHSKPNDATTYAAAMSGPNGYYQLMKAADPTAQVGAVVVGDGNQIFNWDNIVLANAPYDFVEVHWYAQQPGQESDSWLLSSGPANLTSSIVTLRQSLQAAGKPTTTPIMLGEFNSVAYNPGKQSMSIVNALFTGMVIGEVLQDNIAIATWWFGAGSNQFCPGDGINNAASLYGWQGFGGYDLVAATTNYNWNYCTSNTTYTTLVPEGTKFPSGNAFAMVQQFARPGNSMLAVAVDSSLPSVKAYAASQGSGYALMLFNIDQNNPSTATVSVKNAAAGTFTATTVTYGKQQYDDSKNNVWTGPVSASLGSVQSGNVKVTLPPWSMTVLKLQ